MAGLLDWAASPEAMGLAHGLLSGNFAQGVANYSQIAERENAKRQALKDQQMQADEFAQFSQGLLADPQSAAAFALKSRNPQLQKFGMDQVLSQAAEKQKAAARQQMLQTLQAAKTPQEALAAGVPDDIVKSYYESGKWGKVEGKVINDTLIDPYSGKAIGAPIPKQADPFKDLLISGPDGQIVPNKALIGVKSQLAAQGRPVTNVSVNTGQKGFDNTLKLRGDFRSEPVYKAHNEVQSAHAQISEGLKMASPAGDLAAATKIMKILDPGSVVRESELGMAMAATGLGDRLQYYAQNVIKGTKLTPNQRKDFQELANRLTAESAKQYNAKRSEYQGIAERNGLSVPDVLGSDAVQPKAGGTSGGWGIREK